MSVYSRKGKGWRYDFTMNGQRYTGAWLKTKRKAEAAEHDRRKEVGQPREAESQNRTDMAFLELVNLRLDYLKDRTTPRHYQDIRYRALKWVEEWASRNCAEITTEMVETFVRRKRDVSAYTANAELKFLRALFNFGRRRRLIETNPTDGLEFYPVEKRRKYIPPAEDIEKVVAVADPDTQDYLRVLQDTLARFSEINQMVWDDVDLQDRSLTLYTRKKRDRSLTPRRVPMTDRVFEIMSRRLSQRRTGLPWVFWQRLWNRELNRYVEAPYGRRNRLMSRLCERAGVRHFGFHAFRHAGASLLQRNNVPVTTVQKILGHENLSTTEIYLQTIDGAEREAMRILEKVSHNSHTDSHTARNQAEISVPNNYVN